MGNRGFAILHPKKGEPIHYNLVEADDGYYWEGNGKNIKISSSTRNWMWAENKAQELFRKDVQAFKDAGNFKESYSSMWHESAGYSGSEIHTSTYQRKPLEVTGLKNYGTNPYNLEFQVHQNHKYINGEWFFDTTYYTISWFPTTPTTIAIEKKMYKQGSSTGTTQKLSKVISVDNKKAVDQLIAKFKLIYKQEKSRGK